MAVSVSASGSSGRPWHGPLAVLHLDVPFSFAVGSGRVGAAADVPQPQNPTGLGECIGDIGRAVIAYHPRALDPLAVEPDNDPAEKADHRWLLCVRQNLVTGETGGVIHGHMVQFVGDAI